MDQIKTITSRDNARLVHIRKVRAGKISDEIYIEGLRLAEEVLRSDLTIVQGVVTAEIQQDARGANLVERLLQQNVPICQVPEAVFRSVAETVNPQGVVLIAERPETGKVGVEIGLLSAHPGPLVFLYRINDPSNVGAIFRTAEAAGVSGIIISEGSASAFSPKSIRAAMGANLRVPVWEGATVQEAIEFARDRELSIAAADISGRKNYTDLDWKKPVMAVFGSEAHGLPPEVLSQADETFVIPMQNDVESLNLAVSCGVVLFEAVRQRSLAGGRE